MEVITAEFLPDNKDLFILVADADCNVHVYQYDPERKYNSFLSDLHVAALTITSDPQSLSGQRLLHKSTFHLGHFPISMTLLPSLTPALPTPPTNPDAMDTTTDTQPEPTSPPNHVLLTTQSGSLGLITPVDGNIYRRLNGLQTFLINSLDHACGLNPKGYRNVESERFGTKGFLDGTLLRRWNELSSGKRMEACAKHGDEEELRADLKAVGLEGLGYF
jgi:cleavage and polyadenylation specificity factor subunit 1